MPSEHASPSPSSGRLLSLDAFRGATIASMLWVNHHGVFTSPPVPAQLLHAEWHGCRFTDLIFPFFLFIVGAAMPFSDAKRRAAGETIRAAWGHALRRGLVIFALGVFLQSVARSRPHFSLEVLQRIALCYVAAFAVLRMSAAAQAWTAAGLYAVYLVLMLVVRAPGEPWGMRWSQGHTLAEFLDVRLLPEHAPNNEGLLSTLPAITSVIFGMLAGRLLVSDRDPHHKVRLLCRWGGVGLGVGILFGAGLADTPFEIPFNKKLWTPSYAVLTAGWASMALGLMYWLIDVRGFRRWAAPFVIYGSNALGVYAFTRLFGKWILLTWMIDVGGSSLTLKMWLYAHFSRLVGPTFGSFAYSAVVLAVGFTFCWILWRRRWFLKV
jgi:predicted acyltransferase